MIWFKRAKEQRLAGLCALKAAFEKPLEGIEVSKEGMGTYATTCQKIAELQELLKGED